MEENDPIVFPMLGDALYDFSDDDSNIVLEGDDYDDDDDDDDDQPYERSPKHKHRKKRKDGGFGSQINDLKQQIKELERRITLERSHRCRKELGRKIVSHHRAIVANDELRRRKRRQKRQGHNQNRTLFASAHEADDSNKELRLGTPIRALMEQNILPDHI